MVKTVKHIFAYSIFFLWICLSLNSNAQNVEAVRVQPGIGIAYSINNHWKLNVSNIWHSENIESIFHEGNESFSAYSEHTIGGLYSINSHWGAGGAYQLKCSYPKDSKVLYTNRAIQYINLSFSVKRFTIKQRLRFEQHFSKSGKLFRNRYKISFEFPLFSPKLEQGGLYFVAKEELLWKLSTEKAGILNQRLSAGFGYLILPGLKTEFVMQLRTKKLAAEDSHHEIIGLFTASFNINKLFL